MQIKNFVYKLFFWKYKIKNKFLEASLIAFLTVICVFPDVVFKGASFRITDQVMGGQTGEQPRNFYPTFSTGDWSGSYNDNGGALFQSEPMMDFVRNSITAGQSPYWNPYSGIGSLGPETLVDQKFSFFTILYSLSWGGASAYNTILLSLYYFSIVFLCLIIREQLNLSLYAAIAAALFFLLNGYSSANFGSNVNQNYLYLPMCLYSGIALANKISALRFIRFTLAFSIFFSCTFIPTEITSLFSLYLVMFSYLFMRMGWESLKYREILKIMMTYFFGTVLAICILGILYIPIFANIIESGEIESYAKRIFYPINFPQAILSLFSPTHFYQSYNAMETRALLWNDGFTKNGIVGNTVYHMGVVGILLAGCSIGVSINKYSRLIIALFVCIILGFIRLFNPHPLDGFFQMIPVLGNIGSQYWWPVVVFPMCFLISFGVENLIKKKVKIIFPMLLTIIGLASIYYVNKIYGLQAPNFTFKKISIIFLVITFLISVYLIFKNIKDKNNKSTNIILVIIFLLFIELIVYSKMIRMPRHDYLSIDPSITKFLRDNSNGGRTLTIGYGGIYPELGSALQIQEATTFNFGTSEKYIKFFKETFDLGDATQMFYGASLMMMQDTPESHRIDWRNINLLGIKFIVLPIQFTKYDKYLIGLGMEVVYRSPYTIVYMNPNVIPRAFTTIFYSKDNAQNISLSEGYDSNLKPVIFNKYENTFVEILGESDSERLLVISDGWHKNWHAFVNGAPSDLLRVNGILRGVLIPQGAFTVQLKYQSKALMTSYIVSSMGLLTIILIAVLGRHKRQILKN
jgi:hypothetical protein